MDACAAVEKELFTTVDADPFVSTRENWRWIKPKMRAARFKTRLPLAAGATLNRKDFR